MDMTLKYSNVEADQWTRQNQDKDKITVQFIWTGCERRICNFFFNNHPQHVQSATAMILKIDTRIICGPQLSPVVC